MHAPLTAAEIAELRHTDECVGNSRLVCICGLAERTDEALPRLLEEVEANRAAVNALDALVREVTRSGRAGEIYLGAKLGDARRVLIRLGRSIE